MEDDVLFYDRTRLKPFNEIFEHVSDIGYERFEEVYVVGGFVRDLIIGRDNHDLDFAIIGDALEFAKDLAVSLGLEESAVTLFKNFGTAHFKYKDVELEFVRTRKESYTRDSRKPFVVPGTLHDDLSRRDFTINAMAISLNRTTYGDLVDPFDGISHLNEHLLKTPLPAAETFDDDPLRIMRMCRFASQLSFVPAQEDLYSAATLVDRLEIISQERITTEFLKIMESPDPVRGLKLLMAIGAFGVFLPELVALEGQEQRNDCHHKDVWLHTLEVVEKVSKMTENVWVRVGALFHDIGKPQTKGFIEEIGWTFHGHEEAGAKMIRPLFEKLKLPFEQIPLVETIVGMHGRFRGIEHSGKVTKAAVRRLIVASEPYLEELLIVYKCDFSSKNPVWVAKMETINKRALDRIEEVLKSDADIIKFKLALDGKRIMEILNLKEGRDVGIAKGVLECALIEGFVANDEKDLTIYLNDIKDDIIPFAIANNLLFKRDLPNAEEIAGKIFPGLIEKE